MAARRYDRADSIENDGDLRYDIAVSNAQDFLRSNHEEDEDSSDTESAYSDHEKELSEAFIAADAAEMEAAASSLSRSNSDPVPEALLHRIASTLSSSPMKLSVNVDSLKEAVLAVEAPSKVFIPSHEMDINEEFAAAAADLDRCIQVLKCLFRESFASDTDLSIPTAVAVDATRPRRMNISPQIVGQMNICRTIPRLARCANVTGNKQCPNQTCPRIFVYIFRPPSLPQPSPLPPLSASSSYSSRPQQCRCHTPSRISLFHPPPSTPSFS